MPHGHMPPWVFRGVCFMRQGIDPRYNYRTPIIIASQEFLWYFFSIVLKNLAILVLVLACAQKPFPIQGEYQHNQPESKAAESYPNAQAVAAAEVEEENAANAQRKVYYQAHPQEYFWASIAPANFSNWILAGLGLVGGVLGGLTLWTINRQVNLQAAALRQWVDVEGVEAGSDKLAIINALLSGHEQIELRLQAVNNTPYPLTLKKIVSHLNQYKPSDHDRWDRFEARETVILPPSKGTMKSSHPFFIPISIEEEMVEVFHAGRYPVGVRVDILFEDCMGKKQKQEFAGMYMIGPDCLKALPYAGKRPENKN